MKVRTLLVLIAALAALLAFVSFYQTNNTILAQQILLWGGGTISVGLTLIAFFGVGLAIPMFVGLSRELLSTIERWRHGKAARKAEEIEEEYSRGLVAILEGREDEGLGHLRKVLEWDSRHFNTLIKIGEVLRAQGKYAEAIEYHRKAHNVKRDNTRPLYALVEDHEAKGDMDRARTVLGQIIGINKNSIAAWRKLRSLHMKENNWDQALEAHERVSKLSDPKNPRDAADKRFGLGIRYEIASRLLGEGKTKEAVSGLRRLLKDDEQFIPAHGKLGESLRELGQESEAVQAWYRGFERTGSPIFLTMLEEHYLGREQPLAAIEALKRCVGQAVKDTVPRFYLGKLYFRLEMLDDALSVLSSLEGRATYAPTLHYLLGRIHERRNNHREATSEYRKVIKEMDLVQLEYKCLGCAASTMEWSHRCTECGEWNVIEVNFREEIPLEDLGIAPAPIYTR
ncbi:MAG: tetratricopeptide repeat protein [bacterium]|nr:tetratricopeptide repeat protein [bacterium]